ncbi:MAG: SagB/ThcOx family dehydrogenase [archaeon]
MDDSVTRRTIAKLTALLAVGGSALLGWLLDAFEFDRRPGESPEADGTIGKDDPFALPRPRTTGAGTSVATAIADRRSRREYGTDPLTSGELGQLLWAAQGITERNLGAVDFRSAPSAGATYPLEVFVIVGDPGVVDLDPGIYHYDPQEHGLDRLETGNVQAALQRLAIDQEWVGAAAIDIVITGIDERTTQRYGERGRLRYVPIEAGHVGQNIYLQAEALDLATVAIGAFRDERLRELIGVAENHRPLCIYPVGRRS